MASNSIPSQLCRQDVQNPGVIRAASCWKGESLPCRSQRLLAILGRHWLVHASARLCLQLPMGSYTLGLQISLFLVELWLIRIAVWQKPIQHRKAIFLQLKNKLKKGKTRMVQIERVVGHLKSFQSCILEGISCFKFACE